MHTQKITVACESCGDRDDVEAGEPAPRGWLLFHEKVDNYRADIRHANSSRTPPPTLRVVRLCQLCAPDYVKRVHAGRARGDSGPYPGYSKE